MVIHRIVLIRHGQTEWSRSGRHTSVTDVDLTETGAADALTIGHTLATLGIAPKTVLVSPRKRAQRTAQLAGLPADSIDEDLAEWAYGDYEGRTTPQIRAEQPGWQIFSDGAPGGESVAQVHARVTRVLDRARRALTQADVALVCHGHISRALAAVWIGLPISAAIGFALDPAAVTVLTTHHGDPIIERANYFTRVADGPERTGHD